MNQPNAIPRLMTFNWLTDEVAFIVSLHTPFIEFFSAQFENPGRLLEDFLNRNPGFKFDLNNRDGIGLDECLKYHQHDAGGISFKYKIPPLYRITENSCPKCDGTKINPDNNWKCYHCGETGKEVISDKQGSNSFSDFGQSLYILCKFVDYCASNYSPHASKEYSKTHDAKNVLDQQTMIFGFSEEIGITKAYAWAWLHNSVIEKVFDFDKTEVAAVCQAMQKVETTLFLRESKIYNFRLDINDDHRFWLQIPGSACTLGLESQNGNQWDWGKTLSPHNIDHRIAQISFLAGITVLNEICCSKKSTGSA